MNKEKGEPPRLSLPFPHIAQSVFVIWHKELLCFLWLVPCWLAVLAATVGWRRKDTKGKLELADLLFLVNNGAKHFRVS